MMLPGWSEFLLLSALSEEEPVQLNMRDVLHAVSRILASSLLIFK